MNTVPVRPKRRDFGIFVTFRRLRNSEKSRKNYFECGRKFTVTCDRRFGRNGTVRLHLTCMFFGELLGLFPTTISAVSLFTIPPPVLSPLCPVSVPCQVSQSVPTRHGLPPPASAASFQHLSFLSQSWLCLVVVNTSSHHDCVGAIPPVSSFHPRRHIPLGVFIFVGHQPSPSTGVGILSIIGKEVV
ncbi:hypothetical protein JAAARDRAFT_339437 [Jaapia argillacea MUCL 33604]|uniref:Uncharacterized protein n=1 Tax=Jaapia argillacea MUCL 33604 TaxID=933084 RepID=A0A067PJQ2_9AGAM|nr:hypothetical protein JAAARDRAFT_339437 [Jaapia argillacea MUCL 33604]